MMLERAAGALIMLALAGLCAASPPLPDPDNTPRDDPVLEPIQYRAPPIPRHGSMLLSAHPLDADLALLTGSVVDFGQRPAGSSPLPFVIANLSDNSKSFRESIDLGISEFSVGGVTAALLTSTTPRAEWLTRLWVVELETWRAIELLETPSFSTNRSRALDGVSVSPGGDRLLISYAFSSGIDLLREWGIYDLATSSSTHLSLDSGLASTLQWAPDGLSLLHSRVPRTSGRALTVVERVGLDGEVTERIGTYSAKYLSLGRIAPTGDHALISVRPDQLSASQRSAILDLSTGKIVELDDDRAGDGRKPRWSCRGNSFSIIGRQWRPMDPEPSHVFEIGLDGRTMHHWEIDDHQVTDVFWMPGRDDPYAVTTRGEIYLLHGEGDNTFRRRVWSIHRSPLRNP